jgi:hypothetical protein
MANFFMYCIRPPVTNPLLFPQAFDEAWLATDKVLWESAKALDRKGESGTVAKKFGLFDPADPERLNSMKTILKEIRTKMAEREPVVKPGPSPSVRNIHPVASAPSVAVSGHAYMADTKHMRAKEKVKTKGAPSTEDATDDREEEEEEDILPDVLPKDFKIGKKLLKVR